MWRTWAKVAISGVFSLLIINEFARYNQFTHLPVNLFLMPKHIATYLHRQSYTSPYTVHHRWWGPIWRGLAVEETAKHYKAMGKAVWLYIYLIVHANRKTGTLFRLIPSIARDMGIPVRTIRAWVSILRKHGYIITESNGRGLTITVLKWRPLRLDDDKRD